MDNQPIVETSAFGKKIFLKNIQEISTEEFLQAITFPVAYDSTTCSLYIKDYRISGRIFYNDFNDTGYCCVRYDLPHINIPRVFKFGCNHVFKKIKSPKGLFSGYHEDKCTICGFERRYDTSD